MAHKWWTLTIVLAGDAGGTRSGLTAAARPAAATAAAARAGFTGSLNTILLIGAVTAAIAAITSLTLIRGRDFAARTPRWKTTTTRTTTERLGP
jgi:hypothetical protein